MEPKIIIFSAPSGSGKTTIVRHLMNNQNLRLEFSVSATSREPRSTEKDGTDYYFLSVKEFQNKIKKNEFLEWEEVYDNQYYGTLKSEVERIWSKGNNILFDIDVKGGLNIKKIYSDKALAIFVAPPSLEELKKRILNRSTENEESLMKRLSKAEHEISFANRFDIILTNKDLQNTLKEAEKLVSNFIHGK